MKFASPYSLLAITKLVAAHPLIIQTGVEPVSAFQHLKGSALAKLIALLLSSEEDGTIPVPIYDTLQFWCNVSISIVLVLSAGVFAGLTLALMGLDTLHLRVLAVSSDSAQERRNAQKVISLLRKGRHWVLVVLLLSNVVMNETLPVFLDNTIGGGLPAVAISTVAIAILRVSSRIIPQAIGIRYGLAIGAACAPFVSSLMWLMYPIAYPTARLLDKLVGIHESHTYKKTELKSLLALHRTGQEPLQEDEITILTGVLELSSKKVERIMTPLKDVVTLSSDAVLDKGKLNELLATGYSRFPVHAPGEPLTFVGLLLVKKLLSCDMSKGLPISSYALSMLPEAGPDIDCFQALNYFRTGRSHLLLISKTPGESGGALGVVTLEDVIEEMIMEEIVDETDCYEDNVSKRKVTRQPTTSSGMSGIVENLEIHDTGSSLAAESDATLVGKQSGRTNSQFKSEGEDEAGDGNLLLDFESDSDRELADDRVELWRKGSPSEQSRPTLPHRNHSAAV
ncbi:hypothetical protein PM082_013780 [Marasmius tenuissimus]|nr:hypothetical protein PM082_013780 [Marasmius tenuissimus]